jgi:hypothetical protein
MLKHISAFGTFDIRVLSPVTQVGQGVWNACGIACMLNLLRDRGLANSETVAHWSKRVDLAQDGTTPKDLLTMAVALGGKPVVGNAALYPYIELVQYAKLPAALQWQPYRDKAFLHWIVRADDTTYYDPLYPEGQGGPLTTTKATLDAAEVSSSSRVSLDAPPRVLEQTTTRSVTATVTTEVRVRTAPRVSAETWTPLALREGQVITGEVQGDWLKYSDPRFVQYDEGGKRLEALYSVMRHNGVQYIRVQPDTPPVPPAPPAPAKLHAKYLLGIHSLNQTSYAFEAAALGCRAFTVMDDSLGAYQLAQKYPDAIVMVRRYFKDRPSPEQMIELLAPGNLSNLYYTFSNEASNANAKDLRSQFDWDKRCAELLWQRAPNAKAALLTSAHGNPDVTSAELMRAFNETYGAFLNANYYRAVLDTHSYTLGKRFAHHPPASAQIVNPVWLETRNQFFVASFADTAKTMSVQPGNLSDKVVHVSSETGVEAGAGGFSWAGYSAEQFEEWCVWWVNAQRNSKAPYRAATHFQASGRADWGGYNVYGYYHVLAKLWQNDVPVTRHIELNKYAPPPVNYHPEPKVFDVEGK